jgi:fumarylacetoacetate (FAA) hydrolase
MVSPSNHEGRHDGRYLAMKLGTLKDGTRDGALVVVTKDLARCARVPEIARTLQAALDEWAVKAPLLAQASAILEAGGGEAFDPAMAMAPLPRAYQWVDGSAYLHHVELVRKARKAEMPPEYYDDPLMYQGGSDRMIGPCDDVEAIDEAHGIDFEAEIAVVTGDVPMGVTPQAALGHIELIMLVNDVSLRNLIPAELAKGFGFFQSKPSSAFSPVAVTPDELGEAWHGGKVHLKLRATLNGKTFGQPNAGTDMNFDFGRLIAHAARTRPLGAGTIVGSGTVSNRDRAAGSCCIAEVRTIETIEKGKPDTPFMKFGDRIRIEMYSASGASIFGAIDQKVVRYAG